MASTVYRSIPPGRVSPSATIYVDPAVDWSRYEITFSYAGTSYGAYAHDLPVTNVTTYTTTGGSVHFTGNVTNNTAWQWSSVKVIVTLYDSNGKMLTYGYGFVGPLSPGAQGGFDVSNYSGQFATMARYTVGTEARRY